MCDCCDGLSEHVNVTQGDFSHSNHVDGTSTLDGQLCWNTITSGSGSELTNYSVSLEDSGQPTDMVINISGATLSDTLFRFKTALGCYGNLTDRWE